MSGPIVKSCACGRTFTAHTWKLLAKVGHHRDFVEKLELRNCPCGSTIARVTRRFMRAEPNVLILLNRLNYGGHKARAALRTLRVMGIVAPGSREIIAPRFRHDVRAYSTRASVRKVEVETAP
jgi:hypothetical protein